MLLTALAPTNAPTKAPTKAPTVNNQPTVPPTSPPASANFNVQLTGMSLSDWDGTAELNFKTTVAANSGNFCGLSGTAICTSEDVFVTSAVRRAIAVEYKLMVSSAAAATSAASELTTYMGSSNFVSDLQETGGGMLTSTIATQ